MPTALQRSRDILANGVARVRAGLADIDRQQSKPGPEIQVQPFDAANVSTPAALLKLGTSIAAARRQRANFDEARRMLAVTRAEKAQTEALEADKTRAEIAKLRADAATGPTIAAGDKIVPSGPYKGRTYAEANLDIEITRLNKPAAPRDERLVQVAGPNGTTVWARESVAEGQRAAQAPRSVTGIERQSLSYFNRAKSTFEMIEKPDDAGRSLEDRIATDANLVRQLQLGHAPNVLQTPDQQVYRAMQRAFTEARLRKESGAAVPLHEVEKDSKMYFAVPGDSPAVIAAKRAARAVVLDGMKFASGRAYDEYYGEPGVFDGSGAKQGAAAGAPTQADRAYVESLGIK